MKSGKLYDESVDMQVVIKSAMDKAGAQAERSLCFVKAEAFASDFAMERRGTELDTDDLSDMTVKHLRDHFGQFLKLHAAYAGVETAGASSLPSASDRLMQAQRYQSRALPAQPDGSAYEFRLFRALLANLCCDELSFPVLDAEQSGKRMLSALSKVLQYVLPFDDFEPSPLRCVGRVHLVVPKRFTIKARCRLDFAYRSYS